MKNLFSWVNSIPDWALITTRGPPALDNSAWVKWMRMDSDCSSCAFTMTWASATPTFGRSPITMFPGDTRAQTIDTNWIWSYSAVLSQERSTHTLLPQGGLQHRPLLGVLQDQATTEEVPSHYDTGNPRIDVSKMSQPNLVSQFSEVFERVTMWLPSWKVNNIHGILHSTATREVLRTADARVHRFHLSH